MKTTCLLLLVATLTGCGTGVEKPTTTAHFGYRCFPEEMNDIQCDVKPGDWFGIELKCQDMNQYWTDYQVWLKTGNVCVLDGKTIN